MIFSTESGLKTKHPTSSTQLTASRQTATNNSIPNSQNCFLRLRRNMNQQRQQQQSKHNQQQSCSRFDLPIHAVVSSSWVVVITTRITLLLLLLSPAVVHVVEGFQQHHPQYRSFYHHGLEHRINPLSLTSSSPFFAPSFYGMMTKARKVRKESSSIIMFAGVGSDDNNKGSNNENGKWDDFLNINYKESENLFKAREYMNENSLPISYNDSNNNNDNTNSIDKEVSEQITDSVGSSLGLSRQENNNFFVSSNANNNSNDSSLSIVSSSGEDNEDDNNKNQLNLLNNNPYIGVVSKLTPSELIAKFTSTAHPNVQNAVRTTILGMLGGLTTQMSFEATTITTGQKLASLMFQLQMTGYMFKNAEYRLSLQQSLGIDDPMATNPYDSDTFLLKGAADKEEQQQQIDPLAGKVRGKIRIKYNPTASRSDSEQQDSVLSSIGTGMGGGVDIEVDAAAYMSELRSEVAKLRDELVTVRKRQEDEVMNKDLLTYIRTLPPRELQTLTNTMSPDVLVAMKGLVNAVMAGIGDGQIGPNTVTEQSAEAMAQLCMWQLVIGYNLRTLEVREEMKKSLAGGGSKSSATYDDDSGIDLSQPGAME